MIDLSNDSSIFLSGPNLNLNIIGESAEAGQLYSYNTLLNSDVTKQKAVLFYELFTTSKDTSMNIVSVIPKKSLKL